MYISFDAVLFGMDWRDELDVQVREELDVLLQAVHKEKNAYLQAKSASNAQLWCALAVLARRISFLELQLKGVDKKKKSSSGLKKAMEKL
ncbi:hypothetical protein HZA98_02185 [Candidatus Woesearchaeota archaeon]|nr:hypothetical protein [Candidatus Woesearchaeota archaeon]